MGVEGMKGDEEVIRNRRLKNGCRERMKEDEEVIRNMRLKNECRERMKEDEVIRNREIEKWV